MAKLTALILAAGYGSRIADVTTDPKSLLKVKDKTLMDWHFESLKKVGIQDVVVVTGYKREVLEDYLGKFQNEFNLKFAVNDDYKIKGNTFSFLYGIEKVESDFLLFDADLIYETAILNDFVKSQLSNEILVGEASIDDIECAKAMSDNENNVRLTIDKREVTTEERKKYKFSGEAIGILKFSNAYRLDMHQALTEFLSAPQNISKNWEHVMNEFLMSHEMKVHQTTNNKWVEIDNKEDLARAKSIFE
jgi:choline kinase